MGSITVRPAGPLTGTVTVGGAKNSVLKLMAATLLAPGRYVIGMDFAKEGVGEHNEAVGTTRLHVDDATVAEGPMRTQVGFFTLCGDGLCVGRDSSDAVRQSADDGSTPTTRGARARCA